MTWNFKAGGHHNTDDWKAEEYELLRTFVKDVTEGPSQADGKSNVVCSSFQFNGNHVQAGSIEQAREVLEAYDAEAADAAPPTSAATDAEAPDPETATEDTDTE